jgi:hypothetical protein
VNRDQQGTITAFVAGVTVALLAMAGLVADGGYMLAARRQAFDEAEAAARAGAQAVDVDALRDRGIVQLLPEQATQDALAYLERTGHHGTIEVTGDSITVHVTFHRPMSMLGLIGLGTKTITGDGTAHGVRGIITGGD